MATRSIVHWECQALEHRALLSRHGNGGLTIHEGGWAYCDGAGADEGGHQWTPTGGVPLESLVRWTAPNGNGLAPEGAPAVAKPNGNAKSARKTASLRRA